MSLSHSSRVPDAGGGKEGGREAGERTAVYTAILLYLRTTAYITASLPKSPAWITLLCAIVAPQTIFSFLPVTHTGFRRQMLGEQRHIPLVYSPSFYLILSYLSLCNAITYVLMVPLTAIMFFVKHCSFLICNLVHFLLFILASICNQLLYYSAALRREIFVWILYKTAWRRKRWSNEQRDLILLFNIYRLGPSDCRQTRPSCAGGFTNTQQTAAAPFTESTLPMKTPRLTREQWAATALGTQHSERTIV